MSERTTTLSGGGVTALRVALALAVVGIALAACVEMAAPTATPMPSPTPTATAIPAPTPAPTPTINADAISSPGGVIDANGALRVASLVLYRSMRFNVTESMVKESILRDFAARHGSSVGEAHEPDRPIWTIIARGDGVDKYGDAFNTMEAALDKATGEPLMVVTYFGEPDLTVPVLTPTPTITPQPRSASMDDAITAPGDPAGP